MRLYDYAPSCNAYKVRLLAAQPELDDGRTLPESAAILWYLADGSPLLPDDEWTRAEILRWLVWEQTDFVPGVGGLRFRLLTGRWTPDEPAAVARRNVGRQALELLDRHLAGRSFLVGEAYSIADIALYGYAHRATEAGFTLEDLPAFSAWLERVAAQDGHTDDVEPYPPNARPGAGRSIYG